MEPLSPDRIAADYRADAAEQGIIVYRPIQLVEVDAFQQVNLPDSSKPGSTLLSGNCKPVVTRKVVTIADANHPYLLHYKHGLFEAYSFSATLNSDGILTAINTQSTPDQGKTLQNLAGAASTAGNLTKLFSTSEAKPDCTVTPVFVGYEHLPAADSIPDFGKTAAPQ